MVNKAQLSVQWVLISHITVNIISIPWKMQSQKGFQQSSWGLVLQVEGTRQGEEKTHLNSHLLSSLFLRPHQCVGFDVFCQWSHLPPAVVLVGLSYWMTRILPSKGKDLVPYWELTGAGGRRLASASYQRNWEILNVTFSFNSFLALGCSWGWTHREGNYAKCSWICMKHAVERVKEFFWILTS